MTDETEVIESEHICTAVDEESSGQKSSNYEDTEVTEGDRTVRFWNTATFSDTSVQKRRRVRFGINVEGGIQWDSGGWYEYTSPQDPMDFTPDKEITVPDTGESYHLYDVKTEYEIQEHSGVAWGLIHKGSIGPYTAKVNENGQS